MLSLFLHPRRVRIIKARAYDLATYAGAIVFGIVCLALAWLALAA